MAFPLQLLLWASAAESRHYLCCRRRRCDLVATCVGSGPVPASANANHVVIGSAPAAAAVGVGGGGATPPLPPTSVARLTTCVHWGAGRSGWPEPTAAQWLRHVE